jgi:hypothetical protein
MSKNVEMTSSAEFLSSPLLTQSGFRHAFFTRQGGVSSGAYATLNFSVTVGDLAANVRENLRRASDALGVNTEQLHFLSQVHGRGVVRVEADAQASSTRFVEGDALLTRARNVACAVRTADCVPVLLADRRSGAVAAVHAGWRGAVQGVARAAVQSLRELAGGNAELVAAIGPHISLAAFEVSADVAAQILAASLDPGIVEHAGPKPHVDLCRMLHAELRAAGVLEIDHVHGCTVREPERFFSYRRDGQASGRHLSAIVTRL